MSKLPANLSSNLNQHISHLCPFSLGKLNNRNHCAHFVSHVMGYDFAGSTCKNLTYADKQRSEKGAVIRVNNIFNRSKEIGLLSNKPAALVECLIFVTLASNVTDYSGRYSMRDHPRKHIGILANGKVWNYSNGQDKVVAEPLSAFETRFRSAYHTSGDAVEFFYGRFL